jgi:hypothetical protein
VLDRFLRFWPEEAGTSVLVTSPGQQHAVLERLRAAVPDLHVVLREEFDPEALTAGYFATAGLPPDPPLAHLNLGRSRVIDRRAHLVFVIDLDERVRLQQVAGDACAVLRQELVVPFVRRTDVRVEDARRQLVGWIERHVARLDLKGLARTEREDLAFRVTDAWEPLEVEPWPLPEPATVVEAVRLRAGPGGATAVASSNAILIDEAIRKAGPGQPLLLVGDPGSGKTFALRRAAVLAGEEEGGPLPILLPISGWGRPGQRGPLLDHLRDALALRDLVVAHVLDAEAEAGRVLFLLDGLDEAHDHAARQRTMDAVVELAQRFPRCRVVVTSRPGGLDGVEITVPVRAIRPLSKEGIDRFVERWCRLAAESRLGPGVVAQERGGEDARALRDEIRGNERIQALAGSPLLLTVIAMVRRAGLRLPEHRAELYEHITRLLVERWTRARAVEGGGSATPIRMADALRLLGPVAWHIVSAGDRGEMAEAALRQSLDAARAGGAIRGVETTDGALALFRDQLGLFVESAPGRYRFLHLSLGEYFAAQELVRTDQLERLCQDAGRAFDERFLEPIRLAVGVLGLLRAEDRRLGAVVEALAALADGLPGDSPNPDPVPVLLGILHDDAGLSSAMRARLVGALVPKWCFDTMFKGWIPNCRIGRLRPLHDALVESYSEGWEARIPADAFSRGALEWLWLVDTLLFFEGLEADPLWLGLLSSTPVGRKVEVALFDLLPLGLYELPEAAGRVGRLEVSIHDRDSGVELARTDLPVGPGAAAIVLGRSHPWTLLRDESSPKRARLHFTRYPPST